MPNQGPSLDDACLEILGVDLPQERLNEIVAAYRDVLTEIQKLRSLDLTDVHPAIVFEPTAPYRRESER